jgi:hypothetical protein
VQTIGADVIPSDRAAHHPGPTEADLLRAFRDDQPSDEDMVTVRELLSRAMPPDSMINDLRDWDIHVEDGDYLSDDWLREAAFGEADTESECAEELAELFLLKCDEFDMDYDQASDRDGFAVRVQEAAIAFIRQWRARLLAAPFDNMTGL